MVILGTRVCQVVIGYDEIKNDENWRKMVEENSFSPHGGTIIIKHNETETDIVEFGIIPSHALSQEINEEYNGLTTHCWVSLKLTQDTDTNKQNLKLYIDRVKSILIEKWMGMGEIKGEVTTVSRFGNNITVKFLIVER